MRWILFNAHIADGLQEPHAQAIDSIVVTECSGDSDSTAYRLQNVELDVQAYQLRVQSEQDGFHLSQHGDEPVDMGEDGSTAKVLTLPSKELDGLWESYDFRQARQVSS